MANYPLTSPWANTAQTSGYLDRINPAYIPPSSDDIVYQIDSIFNFRPDALSSYIYNTPKLWWVFATRNPQQLRDPVFDFVTGTIIMIPTYNTIKNALGL
jgi:hypothetical protein